MIPFSLIVGVGLVLSVLSPWLIRRANRFGGSILALYPAGVFAYVLWLQLWGLEGKAIDASMSWVPSLGISLGIYVDGLSTLFLLLISGIGTFILLYADSYLGSHAYKGRFYGVVVLFMVSMIGLVIAGDLLTLFLFWELTGVSSYLLIGFNHEQEASRRAALHALLVTGIGGLALLAGFVLVGIASGGFGIPTLLQSEGSLQLHELYLPMLLLILAGVFTKSAQVPFHFWLPSAMEAPTPVSAYLHSATMVKAGVYLLARLTPVLGGTDQWHLIVTTVGAVTMLFGALVGYFQRDLKGILAYTTISALGTLVLLLGLNTSLSAQAAMVFLVVHSLYKGGLFLVTGNIDHETGTRDIERLGRLRSLMPITGAAAVLAAVSMAGLPPMLGYISKELLYEAKLQAETLATLITGAGVFANFMVAATAAMVVVRVFFGSVAEGWEDVHEAPFAMWIGPMVLAGTGFAIALFPEGFGSLIIEPAVLAIHAEITDLEIPLWHGMSPVFLLSILTLGLGLLLFLGHWRIRAMMRSIAIPLPLRPSDAFESLLTGMKAFASNLTGVVQSGYLRRYVSAVVGTAVVMVGATLLRALEIPDRLPPLDVRPQELAVILVMAAAAVTVVLFRSRMAAILAMGVVGYGMALLFSFFSAPDLAMTQVAVETLIVVIFVLIVHKLPLFSDYSTPRARLRDAIVAGIAGLVMAVLTFQMALVRSGDSISGFFAENSLLSANGRNVVNVILVDFRALDTLGEITVLAIAALGVSALLRSPVQKSPRVVSADRAVHGEGDRER